MNIDHAQALDLIQHGAWDQAHQLVQAYSDRISCLIHAYLHRAEGDLSNARYWYHRAGETMPENTLEEEFERLRKMVTS